MSIDSKGFANTFNLNESCLEYLHKQKKKACQYLLIRNLWSLYLPVNIFTQSNKLYVRRDVVLKC